MVVDNMAALLNSYLYLNEVGRIHNTYTHSLNCYHSFENVLSDKLEMLSLAEHVSKPSSSAASIEWLLDGFFNNIF